MKSLKNIFILIGLLIIQSQVAEAQNTAQVTLPSIVPPPADAGSLGQYGNIPVSLSSGLANISVPLYEIKTSHLSVPITLSYYASGIKVDQLASWVGLGWSLNAGGLITRTIRGLDDFSDHGYYYSTVPQAGEVTSANSWDFFAKVIYKTQDSDPDFFFYNFLSNSGKFVFGEDKSPIIINYQQPLKIQYIPASKSFIILDDKGNSYYFNDQEQASSGDYHGNNNGTYTSSWYLSQIISADKSDTISFTYFTDNLLEQDFLSYAETIGPTIQWKSCTCPGGWVEQYNSEEQDGHNVPVGEPYIKSYPLRLKEIDFKNGKISFFSNANRLDVTGVKLDSIIVYNYNYGAHQYNPIKKVTFSYNYFTTGLLDKPYIVTSAYRLRLDSVSFYGGDYSYVDKYGFIYDSTMLPWVGSLAKDLFGYYNGKINNASLVPSQTVSYSPGIYNVGGADRSVDPDSIQAGILKRIVYPTGGFTDFDYEPNSYQTNQYATNTVQELASATGQIKETDTATFTVPLTVEGHLNAYISPYSGVQTAPLVSFKNLTTGASLYFNNGSDPVHGVSVTDSLPLTGGQTYQLIAGAYDTGSVYSEISVSWLQVDSSQQVIANGGGLRIKETTNFDYEGRFLNRELYKYGINERGYGYMASPSNLLNVNSYQRIFDYGYDGMAPISGSSTTREIFTGSSIYDLFPLTGAPISYQQVARYELDSLNNVNGKTIFNYSSYQNRVMPGSQSYNEALYVTNDGWTGARLLSQDEYSFKDNIYWPVKETTYNYNSIPLEEGRGLKIGLRRQYSTIPALDDSADMANGAFGMAYYYFDYPIYSGAVLPGSQTIYTYDSDDTTKYVVSQKQFTYDNTDDLQPSTILSNMSNGQSLLTIDRYPEEVDSIAGLTSDQINTIDSMVSRHNITTLIQSQTYQNSTPVSLLRNDYMQWNADLIEPDSIEYQNGTAPLEKRIQFYNYDPYGNILTDSKSQDIFHSYIWDYNNEYPIAEAVNASQSDIAYTSFEADCKGNWTFSGTPVSTYGGITGTMSYPIFGNPITKSGLTASNAYIVSYWMNQGGASVSGGTESNSITGKTIGGWTYYQVTVTGATSITITGSGYMDELRLYPSDAQMTTYTYEPLVGMTSQCDAKNNITYYEYDGFGRLKLVRDEDGNILKQYDYQYQASNNQ